ncbi:MAG: hypothetical protein ACR2JY_07530 [Chloroflexota bacterium]
MPEHRNTTPPGDWARRAAARAAARGGYMAGLLAAYQEMQGMDERQLAAELGCTLERLPLLGLCREPRREQGRFAADVREIAGYAGANVGRLAQLVRTVDTTRALGRRRSDASDGYLAAARDAGDMQSGQFGSGAETGGAADARADDAATGTTRQSESDAEVRGEAGKEAEPDGNLA